MCADVLSFVQARVLSFSVVVKSLRSLQYYRAKTICSCDFLIMSREKNNSEISFFVHLKKHQSPNQYNCFFKRASSIQSIQLLFSQHRKS